MDSFVEFTESIITYSRHWPKYLTSEDNHKGIIIFAHSNMIHLEVILRNILSINSSSWGITVITSKDLYINTLQLCEFLDESIRVEIRDFFTSGAFDLNKYHHKLGHLDFWTSLPYKKVLIVHPDCLIINSNLIEYIDHNDHRSLNSYYSSTLSKDLSDIGNGGIILRSLDNIKKQFDIMEQCHTIPRIIDDFMRYYSLNCLPEFYIHEKGIEQMLILMTRNIIQLNTLWVHSPWKLGNGWKNYLLQILAPKFRVINIPSLKLFSDESESESNSINFLEKSLAKTNNNFSLINLNLPPDNFPNSPWFGVITKKLPNINNIQLVNCLGLYSTFKLDHWIPINKIANLKSVILQTGYIKRLINSSLNQYLEKYQVNGNIYNRINKSFSSDKIEINIIDLEMETLSENSNNKTVLIVENIQQLNDYLHYQPLLFVLPYQNMRSELKSVIDVSDYSYFGYYKHYPCLFLGPYTNLSISEMHQFIFDHRHNKRNLLYLKQKKEHIESGIIPKKTFDILLDGSNITTNNPHICDYFKGKILMFQDGIKHRYSKKYWSELMYMIRDNFTLEHKIQIILSVVEMILSKKTQQNIVYNIPSSYQEESKVYNIPSSKKPNIPIPYRKHKKISNRMRAYARHHETKHKKLPYQTISIRR